MLKVYKIDDLKSVLLCVCVYIILHIFRLSVILLNACRTLHVLSCPYAAIVITIIILQIYRFIASFSAPQCFQEKRIEGQQFYEKILIPRANFFVLVNCCSIDKTEKYGYHFQNYLPKFCCSSKTSPGLNCRCNAYIESV